MYYNIRTRMRYNIIVHNNIIFIKYKILRVGDDVYTHFTRYTSCISYIPNAVKHKRYYNHVVAYIILYEILLFMYHYSIILLCFVNIIVLPSDCVYSIIIKQESRWAFRPPQLRTRIVALPSPGYIRKAVLRYITIYYNMYATVLITIMI